MNRRNFLARFVKLFFAGLFAAVCSVVFYIFPSTVRQKNIRYLYLMEEDDLPRRGVRKIDFEYSGEDRTTASRVYISASDKGLIAFSAVCTHLGCFINWDHNKKEFLCPCHGGKYSIDGKVVAGPPPAPLTKLPLEIKDGKVYIGMKI